MVNAKQKGSRGEREAIEKVLELLGRNKTNKDKRNGQSSPWGGSATPDISVKGLEKLHLEVKNTKAVLFFAWVQKLLEDVLGTSRLPVLLYKMPADKHPVRRVEWFCFHRLSDIEDYCVTWLEAMGYKVDKEV